MPKRVDLRPTDAELVILGVLWQRGPSTVWEVHEAIAQQRQTGYTTTLKLLQIMTDKGLVARDKSRRKHVYRAKVAEEQTQRKLVKDLLEKAFGGSSQKLVMQALSSKKTSAKEIEEIRKLLDDMEGEK